MTNYYKHMDQFAVRLASAVTRWRWAVLIATMALAFWYRQRRAAS